MSFVLCIYLHVILVVAFVTISSSTMLLSLLEIRKPCASINAVKIQLVYSLTAAVRPTDIVHNQSHTGYLHVLHACYTFYDFYLGHKKNISCLTGARAPIFDSARIRKYL